MRSKLFIMGLFLLLVLSACNVGAGEPQELDMLRMAISQRISYAPIFIADAEGYFEEFGIKMEFVPFNGSNEALALLLSGDTDIYAGTLNAGFLNIVAQEENIKAVADRGHISPGDCTYQALFIRKDLVDNGDVTEPADLAGLTFSSGTVSSDGYLLSSYLALGGLSFDDIVLTDLSTSADMDALANKSIAGGNAPEPDLTRILNGGNALILARAEEVLGTYQVGIIAFGKKLLVDQPELGARFLAAYLKGIRQYNEGKTERNLRILSEMSGDSPEILQQTCWVSLNDDGNIDFAGVDPFQQWSIGQGHLDTAVSEGRFWDPTLLVDALKLLNP